MIYVTLLDQFHPGIYSSQVIDVCNYLNVKHKANIRLVAFLSVREMLRSDAKKKIKQLSKNALVLPAFPGLKNYEWTALFLFFICLVTGERVAICRNAFCTKMALRVKRMGMLKKVVLDSRSALVAESSEYDVFPNDFIRKNIKNIESFAVNNSDFRLAVSNKLVNFWNYHFRYQSENHVVIPCTLDSTHFNASSFRYSADVEKVKENLSIGPNDIVLVYSGSTAPWQSFELLENILSPLLINDPRIKILFLSKENYENKKFQEKHKDRIFIRWLEHKDVLSYLHCCDYGILLREQSDTNKVASPVKFAEYLYAGLPVLISGNLGDFSEFVRSNNCGNIIAEENQDWSFLKSSGINTKEDCFNLAKTNFMKSSETNNQSYELLLKNIGQNS